MKILAVDTNSVFSRAFYTSPMTFFSMVDKVLQLYKPDGTIFCFDTYADSWRKKLYPSYKHSRKKNTAKLKMLRLLWWALTHSNNVAWAVKGYEADDLLYALALVHRNYQNDFYVLSGDKDLLALVKYGAKVIYPAKHFDPANVITNGNQVFDLVGCIPEEMQVYKALMGDSGDDVPGVYGVGPATARKILDTVYVDLDVVKPPPLETVVGGVTKHPKVKPYRAQFTTCYELVGFKAPVDNPPAPAYNGDFTKAKRIFNKHLTTAN